MQDYTTFSRPMRLRRKLNIRNLVGETSINVDDFILPIFVNNQIKKPKPIKELEGHRIFPSKGKETIRFLQEMMELGITSFLVFGTTRKKDHLGIEAYRKDGPVQEFLKNTRKELGEEPIIFTDLCLCGYKKDGHCGYIKQTREGSLISIDLEKTLDTYGKIALSHAIAGTDFVAPSGMMDNQVLHIRKWLDKEGFDYVGIMSYSVKYASSFYGPFRDIMDSSPQQGDRRIHQMDPRNKLEALKEAEIDVQQGADIIMVKPALPYLDVISFLKETLPSTPIAAYNVSGEYMILKHASNAGVLDYAKSVLEVIYGIKRAGANIIITYHAPEVALWLKENLHRALF